MINWLVQKSTAHPDLVRGIPPRGMLGTEERVYFEKLKTAKRRQDWLLGRWTAKQLLREVIRQQCGAEVALEDVQVLNGRTRAPIVNCPTLKDNLPALSISHSHRHAFCAAVPNPSLPVGADMEYIEPRSAVFVKDYFTAGEQELIRQATPGMRDTMVTAVWSAKEAALKAMQLGLTVDTRAVSCLIEPLPHPVSQWTPFAIELDRSRLPGSPVPLQGWWRVLDGFVLTLAI